MNLKTLLRDLKRLNLKKKYNFGTLSTKRTGSPLGPRSPKSSRPTIEQEEEEEEVCAICLDEILAPTVLRCGHRFHRDCICRWFNTPRRTCPVCRRRYTLQDINRICGNPEPRRELLREPLSLVNRNRISLDPTGRGVRIEWGDDFEN